MTVHHAAGGTGDEDDDVFVSYAHSDDEVPAGASLGWVTTLVNGLRTVLRRRLGRDGARIWMDHALASHEPVTDTLVRRASRSRTLVLVLSPGYLRSPWCQAELATFHQAAKASGRAPMIFPIEIEPLPRTAYPGPVAELTPVRFWERAVPSGVPRLAGFPVPKADEDSFYWQQVNLLAHGLAQHLDKAPLVPLPVGGLQPVVAPAPPTPPTGSNASSAAPVLAGGLNGHRNGTVHTAAPMSSARPALDDADLVSIYLHGAPEDQANVELIADHLAAAGVQVLMTPEPAEGKTYLDCLREQRKLLRKCQGFVLVRGQGPATNLQAAYQLAQQAFGLRRRDAWAAAIQLPPPGRPGLPIRSPTLVQVDCSHGFRTEALQPFLAGLRLPGAASSAAPGAGHV